MQKTLGILAFAALASGCTSTNISQALASGPLGCSPKEIVIADETVTGGAVHNFKATCAGVEYLWHLRLSESDQLPRAGQISVNFRGT